MRLVNILYKNFYGNDNEIIGRDFWLQFDDRCFYLTINAPGLLLCDTPSDEAQLIPVEPTFQDTSCPDSSFYESSLAKIVDYTDVFLFCFENGSIICFEIDFVYMSDPPAPPIWTSAFYHAHWLNLKENKETKDCIIEIMNEGKIIELDSLRSISIP